MDSAHLVEKLYLTDHTFIIHLHVCLSHVSNGHRKDKISQMTCRQV